MPRIPDFLDEEAPETPEMAPETETPEPKEAPKTSWLKKHYVGLSAGVLAAIALLLGMKNCEGNKENGARIIGVEANIDSLANNQARIIEVVNDHADKIAENSQNIDRLKNRVGAVEDSIDVHRADIDSLRVRVDTVEMRVDTIAKRQEKCPCINPKAARKPARRPARPNNVPVRRDTVVVVVKPEKIPAVRPEQSANGCGDDQNANVVIRGNNNTVTVSNNGNPRSVVADTTGNTVQSKAVGTCTMRTRVTTSFTWKSR